MEQATKQQLLTIALYEDCDNDKKFDAIRELEKRKRNNHDADIVYMWGKGHNLHVIASELRMDVQRLKKEMSKLGLWGRKVEVAKGSGVSPIALINKLIDSHLGSFSDCPGCIVCEKIQLVSQQWSDDITSKKSVRAILSKGKEMTKSEIARLIEAGVTRREIQKAAKMEAGMFSEIIRAWGLNRNTGRKAQ